MNITRRGFLKRLGQGAAVAVIAANVALLPDRTPKIQGIISGPAHLSWDSQLDPLRDIQEAKRRILEDSGFRPNRLVMSRDAYDRLSEVVNCRCTLTGIDVSVLG